MLRHDDDDSDKAALDARPLLALTSSYVQRAVQQFPKQSTTSPWQANQNYFRDVLDLRVASVASKEMHFRR